MNREASLKQLHDLSRMLHQMKGVLGHAEMKHNRPDAQPDDKTDVEIIRAKWSEITSTIKRLRASILEQEDDIICMEPWGEIDFNNDDQLRQIGLTVGYWTLPIAHRHSLTPLEGDDKYQIKIIHTDDKTVYFTTITATGLCPALPREATKARIVPSPVSTLIMLQTRQKDHLKRELLLQNDFAYAHYQEIERRIAILHNELGIPIRHDHRSRLIRKVNVVMRKIRNQFNFRHSTRKK